MSQIKIGPKFFQNELKVYKDWRTAFWRENIQNSYDADASKIDIYIVSVDNDTCTVVIEDNGCGMTQETLEDVYFNLGETTKSDHNSVGGFGKARVLTCFAQESYKLHTNNLVVQGQGSEYNIDVAPHYHKGVRLSIVVKSDANSMRLSLESYLKLCYLNKSIVTVNGKRWDNWTPRNKHARSLSFGEVYTNKSKEAGILVRVNGVQMFSPYTVAPFLVIIEINQSESRKVLLSNRDGLIWNYQTELESFVNELNINKKSALRPKKNKSIRYRGTGTFTSKRTQKPDIDKQIEALDTLLIKNNFHPLDEATRKAAARDTSILKKFLDVLKEKGVEEDDVKAVGKMHSDEQSFYHDSFYTDLFDIAVEDESNNPQVRKVIESYYPHNWDLEGNKNSRWDDRSMSYKPFRAGFDKYKLLVMWKTACEEVLSLLQNELQFGSQEISWSVGWLFSDDAYAMHRREFNVEILFLNPVKTSGTMRFSLTKKRDLIKLISNACHEVAHIVYDDHDEQFANLMNDLLEEAMANQTKILNAMKTAKEQADKGNKLQVA